MLHSAHKEVVDIHEQGLTWCLEGPTRIMKPLIFLLCFSSEGTHSVDSFVQQSSLSLSFVSFISETTMEIVFRER